jgi:hypothetical protein
MQNIQALIKASKSRAQAEFAISAIDWKALPRLFTQLGSQLAPEHEAAVANTTCDFASIIATRDALARVGDKNRSPRRAIVRELCAEIVGWTGVWLSLTDTVDRVISRSTGV